MRLKPLAPGKNIRLTDASARAPKDAPPKPEAVKAVERLGARIDELQDVLYAEGRRALLVVLQGRDTSGKDGTIRKVFGHGDVDLRWGRTCRRTSTRASRPNCAPPCRGARATTTSR